MKNTITEAETIRELMDKYDNSRETWILTHGNDDGFNDWFNTQFPTSNYVRLPA